jgi:hypothetical protein
MQDIPNKISLQDKPAAKYNSGCSLPYTTPVPLDFKPESYTVIVGREREAKENIGDKCLCVLASHC